MPLRDRFSVVLRLLRANEGYPGYVTKSLYRYFRAKEFTTQVNGPFGEVSPQIEEARIEQELEIEL